MSEAKEMGDSRLGTVTSPSPSSALRETGKRIWKFLCNPIPDPENPYWSGQPSAAEVEASLTTEEQRKMRARLVSAIDRAAKFQDCEHNHERPDEWSSHLVEGETKDKENRDTVFLTFEQEYLIQPEVYHHTIRRGAVMFARPGFKQTIFSGGIGTQAYAKRNAITKGLDVVQISMATVVVQIKSEEERELIIRRARQHGYRMSIVSTLAVVLVLLSCAQAICAATSTAIAPAISDVIAFAENYPVLANLDRVESHHTHKLPFHSISPLVCGSPRYPALISCVNTAPRLQIGKVSAEAIQG